jgi:hypothetical protein
MCELLYNNVTGGYDALGLIDGSYETYVKGMALDFAGNSNASGYNVYEGSTNIMIITAAFTANVNYTYNGNVSFSGNVSVVYPTAQCCCTTNNCNANLDVCATGLNYSSSLLLVNASTTLASTIPTTSTSTHGITNNSSFPQSNTTIPTISTSTHGATNNSTFPQNNTTIPTTLSTIMNRTSISNINTTATLSTSSM